MKKHLCFNLIAYLSASIAPITLTVWPVFISVNPTSLFGREAPLELGQEFRRHCFQALKTIAGSSETVRASAEAMRWQKGANSRCGANSGEPSPAKVSIYLVISTEAHLINRTMPYPA